ncbi:nutritional copper sensing transcription factor Cuf1 [Schizosaccharomyces octosporus yFS286]|uniref:Nutritional copper sensing transcription factor Cuf1 n=1 Tax=Schizosaccharomyces octosporus (strain yFS286) TaxID=483514 RepID=S9RLV6_SCHOY|nr:nutritional copper sensing transcription factor Cuf1 [Schizosaccharomyces octosporus yFS286]EPX74954.1 nutritional copper sensing transcription factor Cuf1 [Schizosaccharomyces octosporus yFS286]
MIVVNNAKMACMKCIRGHRSSSCKHDDRELFPIRPRGRPISQCEKCRQARIKRHIHVKCTCSSNTEKRQPQIKKMRNKLPEVDVTSSVPTNSDPSPSSCCARRHSHAPLPFLVPSNSKMSDSDDIIHASEKSESPRSLYASTQHPYHAYSGAGFYRRPEVPECYYKDFYHNNHYVPSPQWFPNRDNYQLHSNEGPLQTFNFENDTSGLQHEVNNLQGFSVDHQKETITDFPESSAYKVLFNSEDSIAAAAASHHLYPQPNSPYPFAMLDDGSYIPLSHNPSSHSPVYSSPNLLNGIKPESDSNVHSHNFPIQLSDYFTLPSDCAQGSSHCKCDDNCQCLGCLTHPNNPTTLAALNHISALQEEQKDPIIPPSFLEEKLLFDNFDDGIPGASVTQHGSNNQENIQYPLSKFRLTPEII